MRRMKIQKKEDVPADWERAYVRLWAQDDAHPEGYESTYRAIMRFKLGRVVC